MAGTQLRPRVGLVLALVVVLGTACGGGGGTTSGATGSRPTTTGPTGPTVATSPPTVTGATGVTGATTSPPGQGGELAGTWSGTWKNTTPNTAQGTFKLTWAQSGSVLSGNITLTGTPCLSGGLIAGALSGSTISFGVVKGAVEVAYTGSVFGTTMSGTYTTSCGNAAGHWQAKKSG